MITASVMKGLRVSVTNIIKSVTGENFDKIRSVDVKMLIVMLMAM